MKTLISIQYLRAVAVGLVLFFHCRDQFPGFTAILPGIGAGGVDLFFVISGFIMVTITAERETSPAQFMLRRIIRIAPLYWFFTSAVAAAALVAPTLFRDTLVTPGHYVLSLLFIPHDDHVVRTMMSPLLKVGWTLNYEMFFYLCFSLSMLIPRWRVPICVAGISVLVLLGRLLPLEGAARFYTDPIMLEFCFGMILGWAYTSGQKASVPWATALVLIGIVLCFVIPVETRRTVHYGIGAAMIVAGGLSLERFVPKLRIPLLLGDASYSIYLAHLYPIVALRIVWERIGMPTEGLSAALLFSLLGIPLGLAVGVAAHLLVERPMLAFFHNRMKARQASRQAS